MYNRYEKINNCEACIKKEVCKYKEKYEVDLANLKEYMTSSETTVISIECKEFSSKITYRVRGCADNENI